MSSINIDEKVILVDACVVYQPHEGEFQVGEPGRADYSWNRMHPYLLVQRVEHIGCESSISVEKFRENITNIVQREMREGHPRNIRLDDISAKIEEAGYVVRRLNDTSAMYATKTL